MGLIEDNSDSIAHLILDKADLEFSGPLEARADWQPVTQARRHHDLVRYVVETAEGGNC